jgi:hypothetical protein
MRGRETTEDVRNVHVTATVPFGKTPDVLCRKPAVETPATNRPPSGSATASLGNQNNSSRKMTER